MHTKRSLTSSLVMIIIILGAYAYVKIGRVKTGRVKIGRVKIGRVKIGRVKIAWYS